MEFDSVEYDDQKRLSNLKKHGVDFLDVMGVMSDPYKIVEPDDRKDYSETRYSITGVHENTLRIMILIISPRQATMRVISYRKANKREQTRYEKHRASLT